MAQASFPAGLAEYPVLLLLLSGEAGEGELDGPFLLDRFLRRGILVVTAPYRQGVFGRAMRQASTCLRYRRRSLKGSWM